ncbi:hypothetical protein PC128_g10045, partial [Phytophthora cactorum]
NHGGRRRGHVDQVGRCVPVQRPKFIGLNYKYDSTKLCKHYWVLDMANTASEVCT